MTRLCDIDSIGIPDEMLEVHIDKERIENQIAALSLRCANEISSIICARGDIVRRMPVEVTDELIASMGIDGVTTVDGYRACPSAKATEEFCRQHGIEIDGQAVRQQAERLGQMMELMGEAEGCPKELEGSNEYYKLFSKTL